MNYFKKREEKKMKDLLNELMNWNEEMNREDRMYNIEFYSFKETRNGLVEADGDTFMKSFDELDEAIKYFNRCQQTFDNTEKHYRLCIEKFIGVYDNNAEYEAIMKYEKGME